ncbi:MAG: AraC family transcriptional regulator, partial [Dysgonamonadaceae bacterium]|nr:AraC family transcriptional regulator [Dysgonamonadaceae bacterium]
MNNSGNLSKNILFSCEGQTRHVSEQVVPEHVLTFVVSGNVEFQFNEETLIASPGSIIIIRRNKPAKATKMPENRNEPCKTINIFLTQEMLRNYMVRNNMEKQERYRGKTYVHLNKNLFIKAYFDSLIPYLNNPDRLTDRMAQLKTAEAIELLLNSNPEMESFLFDLSEPYRIDLEKFINNNFMFNIPISEFARLTGRSLSTFKRDFRKIYNDTPEKWLRERRLEEARRQIIHEGKKPSDVYYQVGFENFSHFSAAYKQFFGHNASDKDEEKRSNNDNE